MTLTILILAVLLSAPLAYVVTRFGLEKFLVLIPASAFIVLFNQYSLISSQQVILEQIPWVPSLGVELSFRADGLSYVMAMLITGIGSAVFLYAASYLKTHVDRPRFFMFLTLFMGAMLGAVLANDLIVMLVFWEMTSLTSFLLIGFEPEKPQSRRAAQQGLMMTVAGGLSLLAACLLIGVAAGTFRIDQLLQNPADLLESPFASAIIVLLAGGAFVKSAQAPLHSWLPNAMVAPTPVSAYLHSATMVKLGVYLLARFYPIFHTSPVWINLLTGVGLLTMLTGSVMTLRESDLKRILAYSTIVSLGLLISLLGLPHALAIKAMVVFLIAHALYKASLFMVAGIIDYAAGTRDRKQLSGLRRKMPRTAVIALLAGLSMAGLPPLMGFLSKELVYEAFLETDSNLIFVVIGVLANASIVVAATVMAIGCFWGPQSSPPKEAKDPAFLLYLGPAVLALIGLRFGIFPSDSNAIVSAAASAITGESQTVSLSIWHGWTPMLLLSGLTLLLGGIVYWFLPVVQQWLLNQPGIDANSPNVAWDHMINRLPVFAERLIGIIQNGSLRNYLSLTIFSVTLIAGGVLLSSGGIVVPIVSLESLQPVAILSILMILAGWGVVRTQNFMAGIIATGMIGFSMSLLFLFRGAPDLAFTQFSVEAVSIVILLAIIGKMPFHKKDFRTRLQRQRDAIVACSFGLLGTLVLMSVTAGPFNDEVSEYFRTQSVPLAHGYNIVNVIIVDFRGFDTLGEITVLSLAALAALSLIASVRHYQTHRTSQENESQMQEET